MKERRQSAFRTTSILQRESFFERTLLPLIECHRRGVRHGAEEAEGERLEIRWHEVKHFMLICMKLFSMMRNEKANRFAVLHNSRKCHIDRIYLQKREFINDCRSKANLLLPRLYLPTRESSHERRRRRRRETAEIFLFINSSLSIRF